MMALVRSRKANAGIGAAVLLMVCIVLFAGTLFWLMVKPGLSLGFGENQENPLHLTGGQIQPQEAQWNDPSWSMNQSILDLESNGCVITRNVVEPGALANANNLSYSNFRTLAMKRRIVFLHIDGDAETLLIKDDDKYYAWAPMGS